MQCNGGYGDIAWACMNPVGWETTHAPRAVCSGKGEGGWACKYEASKYPAHGYRRHDEDEDVREAARLCLGPISPPANRGGYVYQAGNGQPKLRQRRLRAVSDAG
jgi:hypothetical protein